MSALFGHVKGAFTGAVQSRPGLLRAADGGVLFLDEIGELGPDEQAMLLRALEDKTFLPLGSDKEVPSNFQLIAGTNRDLAKEVATGGGGVSAKTSSPASISGPSACRRSASAPRTSSPTSATNSSNSPAAKTPTSPSTRRPASVSSASPNPPRPSGLATSATSPAPSSAWPPSPAPVGAEGGGRRITLDLVEQEIRHLQSLWQHAATTTAAPSAEAAPDPLSPPRASKTSTASTASNSKMSCASAANPRPSPRPAAPSSPPPAAQENPQRRRPPPQIPRPLRPRMARPHTRTRLSPNLSARIVSYPPDKESTAGYAFPRPRFAVAKLLYSPRNAGFSTEKRRFLTFITKIRRIPSNFGTIYA